MENASNITFGRVSGLRCPECGGPTQGITGTFTVGNDDVIQVVAASNWTRTKLAEFQSALDWAVEHYRDSPDDAIRRIAQASPETASVLNRLRRHMPFDRVIQVLTLLATIVVPIIIEHFHHDAAATPQQIIQIINENPDYQRESRPEPPPPPSAAPKPPPRSEETGGEPHPPPATGSPP